MFALAKPLLHALDAETAHGLTIKALEAGLYPRARSGDDPSLGINLFGLDFPNPIGIAAGFDKNAQVPDAMLQIGFGFAEIGTVTPKAQPGNPKPRIFRLPDHRAAINRLGFNNEGHEAARARLIGRRERPGIIGVNVGANKDSDDRIADYLEGLTVFHDLAGYFTVNISSPNTPGLRGLQEGGELESLLTRIDERRARLAVDAQQRKPVLLKIAPDLDIEQLEHVARCCEGSGIDGVIISNTTLARDGIGGRHADEAGGLSGAPLLERSTRLLARFSLLTQGRVPLVGVGGVGSGEDAYAKIRAGASLVQLYTALVYEGPALVTKIKQDLVRLLARDGFETVARGCRHQTSQDLAEEMGYMTEPVWIFHNPRCSKSRQALALLT